MTGVMLANTWYRVAGLKPRLRSHARLHRHRYRGQLWYLLQDPVSNRVHRFTPAARLFIAAMDGERTVQTVWELTRKHLAENAPTQDEVIQLLGQLHSADLLQSDVTPDAAEAFARSERMEKANARRSYMNPMSIRVPVWDPDAFLNRCAPLIDWLWSRWGAMLWLAVVVPALVLLPPHLRELTSNFSDRVLAVDNLVMLWCVFPVIKLLHELGHAAATKRGGGEVHDLGLMLLVLVPVPYVEATAAAVFKSKYQRAMVGAAGMAVEVFIAALAFYLWLLIEPGLVRAVLFNVMLVAGVSTLVFNGNPLLRYDAYYILSDLLEMPNLAQRAMRYWGYLVQRYAFGVDDAETPEVSRSEKAWLVFYGVASTFYRALVTVTIALFIATQFFVVGVLLAIWALAAMTALPVIRVFRHVGGSPQLRLHRRRAVAVTLGAVATLLLLLFVVPAPHHTSAEGVVWLPEQSMVRAGHEGFLENLVTSPGTAVARGDVVAVARDPALEAQVKASEARVAELSAAYAAQFTLDRAAAGIAREQLESERQALQVLRERLQGLTVHAGTDGHFVAPRAADMPGRYYHKGELLGYVIGAHDTGRLVRVVVPQDAVDAVRRATRRVTLRYAHGQDVALSGRVIREVPGGDEYLPSRALAVEGGGHIATDPREQTRAKTLERTFQFDVEVDDAQAPAAAFFGERVAVRFTHELQPIGVQWARAIRLLFLSHFHV